MVVQPAGKGSHAAQNTIANEKNINNPQDLKKQLFGFQTNF